MTITFALASRNDADQFQQIAQDVFDSDVSAALLEAFLFDQRHHIVIAKDGEMIIGFASAVDYIHPDKPREMWINEVGVGGAWRGQGIAKKLLSLMLNHCHELGCAEAWVLTEPENAAANALYRSIARKHHPEPKVAIIHSFKLV